MYKRSLFGLVAATLILSGCDSGSSSSGPSYSGPTAPVSITTTNEANTVTGVSTAPATSESYSATISSNPLPFAPGSIASGTPDFGSLGSLVKTYADKAFKLNNSSSAAAGVTTTYTEPCTSGNTTLTVVQASASGYNTGDSVKFAFNNCVIGSATLTGSIKLALTSFTSASNFAATYTFDKLKFAISSDYSMMHGGFTATVTDGTTFTASITGTSLYMEASYSGQKYQSLLSDFSFVDTYTYATGETTLDHDYTYADTVIGGSVTVETTVAFAKLDTDPYPNTGEVVVTGANNAKVKLVVVDINSVDLYYDLAGNGSYTGPINTLWTDL